MGETAGAKPLESEDVDKIVGALCASLRTMKLKDDTINQYAAISKTFLYKHGTMLPSAEELKSSMDGMSSRHINKKRAVLQHLAKVMADLGYSARPTTTALRTRVRRARADRVAYVPGWKGPEENRRLAMPSVSDEEAEKILGVLVSMLQSMGLSDTTVAQYRAKANALLEVYGTRLPSEEAYTASVKDSLTDKYAKNVAATVLRRLRAAISDSGYVIKYDPKQHPTNIRAGKGTLTRLKALKEAYRPEFAKGGDGRVNYEHVLIKLLDTNDALTQYADWDGMMSAGDVKVVIVKEDTYVRLLRRKKTPDETMDTVINRIFMGDVKEQQR